MNIQLETREIQVLETDGESGQSGRKLQVKVQLGENSVKKQDIKTKLPLFEFSCVSEPRTLKFVFWEGRRKYYSVVVKLGTQPVVAIRISEKLAAGNQSPSQCY